MDHFTLGKPPHPGTEGAGGTKFSREMGFPGVFYSKNITPAGLKEWTDGEILRALTTGIDKNGEVLFSLMPYERYSQMAEEDLFSIIAYIRSLEEVPNEIGTRELDFPVSLLINTMAVEPAYSEIPDKTDMVNYGKYMFNAAACQDCHTPMDDKGNYLEDLYLAGGFKFPNETGGVTRSANITPDEETGIGSWDEDRFVSQFKQYTDSAYVWPTIKQGEFNTEMPWSIYSQMDEYDLRAIYSYLRSVPAINNRIEKFTPDE